MLVTRSFRIAVNWSAVVWSSVPAAMAASSRVFAAATSTAIRPGGLAARRVCDLGECLSGLEIGLKVALADAQIRRRCGEVAAGAETAAEATPVARRPRGL
jgi:hypothetical protein